MSNYAEVLVDRVSNTRLNTDTPSIILIGTIIFTIESKTTIQEYIEVTGLQELVASIRINSDSSTCIINVLATCACITQTDSDREIFRQIITYLRSNVESSLSVTCTLCIISTESE